MLPQHVENQSLHDYAREHLSSFNEELSLKYARMRNFDFGPERHEYVTQLSPYIRHRILLEEECLQEVKAKHSYEQTEKFVQEICWRTYWKGWLEHRPSVWQSYLIDLENLDFESYGDYRNAINGNTGIDAFDFWTQELVETGYLHNHARMWFASIWIHTLNLPWQLGAQFFYDHLLDADPACNTLSWRWVAGLHTKGKTYLARPSNIAKYTSDRFRPKNLATVAPPVEDSDSQHEIIPYVPRTSVLENEETLLLFYDDLSPDREIEGFDKIQRVILFDSTVAFGEQSHLQKDFRRRATNELRERLRKIKIDVIQVENETGFRHWCEKNDTKTLSCLEPFVGPEKELLDRIRSDGTLNVKCLRREWDNRIFPHTTKGFFQLKKHLKSIFHEV